MSIPAVPAPYAPSEKARRLGTWSVLMIPMLLISAIVSALFAMFMLGRHDLEGSEPMSVQGGYGWMVWAIGTTILLVPAAVGLVLGIRARRMGARGSALAGIAVNGLILVGYPTVSLVGLLGQ